MLPGRQIDQLLALSEGQSDIIRAGNMVVDKITAWLDCVIEESNENFIDPLHTSGRLDFNLVGLIGMVDRMEPPLTSGMLERVKDVRNVWAARSGGFRSIIDKDWRNSIAWQPVTRSRGFHPCDMAADRLAGEKALTISSP